MAPQQKSTRLTRGRTADTRALARVVRGRAAENATPARAARGRNSENAAPKGRSKPTRGEPSKNWPACQWSSGRHTRSCKQFNHQQQDVKASDQQPWHLLWFLKDHGFRGIEGAVGLTRWIEKLETVFRISGCNDDDRVKFASFTFMDAALTW